jgi:hypothetical protein
MVYQWAVCAGAELPAAAVLACSPKSPNPARQTKQLPGWHATSEQDNPFLTQKVSFVCDTINVRDARLNNGSDVRYWHNTTHASCNCFTHALHKLHRYTPTHFSGCHSIQFFTLEHSNMASISRLSPSYTRCDTCTHLAHHHALAPTHPAPNPLRFPSSERTLSL